MHKPTNARLHKYTNQQTYKRTFARAHGVLPSRFSRRMSHTALPLLLPCFDVANLKIKIHISKHKRMFVYACMYVFMCLFVRLFVRLFMYACKRMYVCSYIRLFVRLFVRAFVHLHKCIFVFLCDCIFAQLHKHTNTQNTHCQRSSTVMSTLLPLFCISSVRMEMIQYLVFCPARVTVLLGVYV